MEQPAWVELDLRELNAVVRFFERMAVKRCPDPNDRPSIVVFLSRDATTICFDLGGLGEVQLPLDKLWAYLALVRGKYPYGLAAKVLGGTFK